MVIFNKLVQELKIILPRILYMICSFLVRIFLIERLRTNG